MSKIADVVTLLFNPIFIIGVTRLYKILDSIREPGHGFFSLLATPEVHLPIVCCLFTMASSVLSHEANKKFLTNNPNAKTTSLSGLLAFATAGCILVMFYFTTDTNTLPLWFGTYAVLCLFNAAWNFVAVTMETRKPHVYANILLFILLFFTAFIVNKPWHLYFLLMIILFIKTWQRSKHRNFITSQLTT